MIELKMLHKHHLSQRLKRKEKIEEHKGRHERQDQFVSQSYDRTQCMKRA
jgi:hypothetical protein